jgi:hypothetical protein
LSSILKEVSLEENFPGEQPNEQGAGKTDQQVARNTSSATLVSQANGTGTTGVLEEQPGSSLNGAGKSSPKLATLAESATSLGTIVSKTVYALNEEAANSATTAQEQSTYSNKAKKYPNLNFSTLYHSLLNIIEILPSIQSSQISKANLFKKNPESLFF